MPAYWDSSAVVPHTLRAIDGRRALAAEREGFLVPPCAPDRSRD